jgi:3-hydroxybutyryl-CoA dehydratase
MNALVVGDASTRSIGPITQTDVVRVAGAGGDFNPLHHDPAAAAASGFPAPIAMGQFTAGLIAGVVTDWVGVERLRSFEVRFSAPVALGSVIEIAAEVLSTHGSSATIAAHARVGNAVVASATAVVWTSA